MRTQYIHKIIGTFTLVLLALTLSWGQCGDRSNYWEESWISCVESPNPNTARGNSHWILFEFDEPQAISTSQIWNANRLNQSGMGAREITIDISINGTDWIQVDTTAFVLPKGTEAQDYEGIEGPNFSSYGFLSKILITVVNTYGNANCVSIGEIRFDIDTLACYGERDVCGICNGPGLKTFYQDADGDGLGNPNVVIHDCTMPNGYVTNADDPCDNGVYNWVDMQILFDENGCTGCHGNANGAGGLDLTTYQGITQGGNNCGNNLLTGTNLVGIITVDGFDACSGPVTFPSMNTRIGNALDSTEIAMIQSWVNSGAPYDCNCLPGAPDDDNDGICNSLDRCPGFDDQLIGTPCDDGLACTINDIFLTSCECKGTTVQDTDFDGVCDSLDLAPLDPCTADGVVGSPEPNDWYASASNDCDGDNITVGNGDLDDYDDCTTDVGASLKPDCACPGGAQQAGAQYIEVGEEWDRQENAVGLPDGVLSAWIGYQKHLNLYIPHVELGQQICFDLGFSDAEGGVQFEINALGKYKFYNPDPAKDNFEIQQFCFPAFVAGEQFIKISRLERGAIRIDGATYDYCPCTAGDPDNYFPSCMCPGDFTSATSTLVSSDGFDDPVNAEQLPDGVFTGGLTDDNYAEFSFSSLPINTEVCVIVAFDSENGKVGLELNGQATQFRNKTGSNDRTISQEFCLLTKTDGPQTLIVKKGEAGWGRTYIDGTLYRQCNDCTLVGVKCDDGDDCTINDQYDTSCDCVGVIVDRDNDTVCDAEDVCPGQDDRNDVDNDGIPDACDTCDGTLAGTTCDDGFACTTGDIYDANCNCIGTVVDSDNDGVCDANDVCPGGDDYMDGDNNGIPDFCDNCNGNLTGIACDDRNACTTGDVYDADCNCVGVLTDTDNDGVCDSDDQCPGGDDRLDADGDGLPDDCDTCNDNLAGTTCDDGNPCTTDDRYDALCNCTGIVSDADSDGVCDTEDVCPGGDDNLDTDNDGTPDFCDDCNNNLAGTTCDDGNPCTIGDVYDASCNCTGTVADTDNDTVCDADDKCPGGDDRLDTDNDGIPDFCDDCDGNLVGTACDDGITCTENDRYDASCNCVGTPIADADNDGVCDTDDICPGGDDRMDQDNDGIPDFCDDCNGNLVGTNCNDGDVCTINDVYDDNCNCVGTIQDTDQDGVCDVYDKCPGGDDQLDQDNDGIPNFCDDCDGNLIGTTCDDGDDCTSGDVYDATCNCAGSPIADSDNDGVCDTNDICPGGDDRLDTDNDGIPDFCDDCDGNLVGTTCDDADVCTVGDVYDADCNCVGVFADTDNDGVCDVEDQCPGGDDRLDIDNDGIPDFCDDCDANLVGTNCDDADACTVNDVFDQDCNCVGTLVDTDNDGVCDANDKCPGGDDTIDTDNDGIPDFCDDCDDSMVGRMCDDNDPCTVDDLYDTDCNCVGILKDGDQDGVCDAEDKCPGGDDRLDSDNDGIPDFCDECEYVFDRFDQSTLAHEGVGGNMISLRLENRSDVSFKISDLESNLGNDNPAADYIDEVEVRYTDELGRVFTFGTYSGADQNEVDIFLSGKITKVSVILRNGYRDYAPQLSISISDLKSCEVTPNSVPDPTNADDDGVWKLKLYPNPNMSGKVYANFPADPEQVYILTFLDSWGKIKLQKEIKGMSGDVTMEINTVDLPAGIYYVSLDGEKGKIRCERLVIVRP